MWNLKGRWSERSERLEPPSLRLEDYRMASVRESARMFADKGLVAEATTGPQQSRKFRMRLSKLLRVKKHTIPGAFLDCVSRIEHGDIADLVPEVHQVGIVRTS